MALSAEFDVQHTTELRTTDLSLENTYQPASNCMTVNESWRQTSTISISKSKIFSVSEQTQQKVKLML